MFEYIIFLYHAFKDYCADWYEKYNNKIVYNLPFDILEIENDDNFKKFKNSDACINKLIFALNNLPDILHRLIFKNSNVSDELFQINIKNSDNQIFEMCNTLDNINNFIINNKLRYIYIRINILKNQKKGMNHVNCIIIDKYLKYILFFEPKVNLEYNPDTIITILKALEFSFRSLLQT